jgi:hypothetical protein
MTDNAAANAPPPAGLGGWLWPVTWATAVLPVFLTASVVASVPSFIEYLQQAQAPPYPVDAEWACRLMGLNVLLTLVAWWWATRWFARDPRLPRQGPVVLLASGILVAVIAWVDEHHDVHPKLAGALAGLGVAGLLCARWSKRIRNTFVTEDIPAHADEFDTTVFGGPGDWSRGRWLLPGALLYAAVTLCSEWTVFSQIASQTLPAPYPAGPPQDGCIDRLGFGLASMKHMYSASQIEAYGEALSISLTAGLLVLGAFVGLARGARWTPWLTIVALALAMAAPLRIDLGEWCIYYLDHTDFPGMWHKWCVALNLVTIATGFRRWPATQA